MHWRCSAALPLVLAAAVEATGHEDPYMPSCAASVPQQLTLQGDATGNWEDSDWLDAHGGGELIGAAYASVPAMDLQPGDKLAFDTSVLGSDAVDVTLSLASCTPTTTIGNDNAESGLTYTCEEALRPDESVSPWGAGALPFSALFCRSI